MSSTVSKYRGRNGRKSVALHHCSVCKYTSERYYNVMRHEVRIHSSSAKKRQCCDISFTTKGDYYLHCEECHPSLRAANITSRMKYKIIAGSGMRCIPGDMNFSQNFVKKESKRAPYLLRSRDKSSVLNYNEDSADEEYSQSSPDLSTDLEDQSTKKNDNFEYNERSKSSFKLNTNFEDKTVIKNYDYENIYSYTDFMDPLKEYDRSSPQKSLDYGTKSSAVDIEENCFRSNLVNEVTATNTMGLMASRTIFDSRKIRPIKENHDSDVTDRPSSSETSDYPNSNYHDSVTNIDTFEKLVDSLITINNNNNNNNEKSVGNIVYPTCPSVLTSWDLPIKKRILLNFAINNNDNIAVSRHDDSLIHRPNRSQPIAIQSRKKSGLTRRLKRREEMKKTTLQYGSSDEENCSSPVTLIRKQKYRRRLNDGNIDVRIDPRIIGNIPALRIVDYLKDIDFDTFA